MKCSCCDKDLTNEVRMVILEVPEDVLCHDCCMWANKVFMQRWIKSYANEMRVRQEGVATVHPNYGEFPGLVL